MIDVENLIPPEWAQQKAVWVGWPSHADLWLDQLHAVREEVEDLVNCLANWGNHVKLIAMGPEAVKAAIDALPTTPKIQIFDMKFGDIWFRDTGPIFAADNLALRFNNNGWGGKYALPYDDTVGDEIAKTQGAAIRKFDFILEGGAIEHDGEGTVLTTRQCLLNPNRNKGWTEVRAEQALKEALGAKKILWLDEGLMNDHTDGHIDNLARFVAPGKVVCQAAFGRNDPNAALYETIADALSKMTDAAGRKLEVIRIPSPGLVENEDGEPMPASHMNFIIGNKAVAVPTYGTSYRTEGAAAAVKALRELFPGRKVEGIGSSAILTGGGSFHCITQQVPAGLAQR